MTLWCAYCKLGVTASGVFDLVGVGCLGFGGLLVVIGLISFWVLFAVL